ncbi:putative MFS family arabinose efflux permease [Stackebrandtia albiflava]|uniref:Putative MFS family arabinose efflux permease n=1 Tax=Stackebrandtia albiflava TaxID=406432 RepID=A0A562VBC8_9ACTN|nr:MFS transporter [Stackebrandtia albiflava]TWJ15121.1 putative MFS family arabinose efflux permease [Stackebrandtia albiflava]
MTSQPRGLLRRHADFRRLWLADALSAVGTRIGMLALPMLALLHLDATAFEVALLHTLETLGSLLLGLLAGAWIDRMRCRPVMIGTDIARFALVASIPAAAFLGVLTMTQLYVVAFVTGIATVFFTVAATTYLPRLVADGDLVSANAKLATNTSVAAVLANGAGGLLIQALTAPVALAIDAAGYLWSAVWLRRIRHREQPPTVERRHLGRDVVEGLRFVASQPVLRALAGYSACTMLFQSMHAAVTVVFLVEWIGLGPAAVGLVGMSGLLGALVAGPLTHRLAARFGGARVLCAAAACYAVGFAMTPLTRPGWETAWWITGNLLLCAAIVTNHILSVTTRQLMCPPGLHGRVGATMNFMIWGVMPIGSLLGGVVATLTDVRVTLWIVAAGVTVSALWIVASPLRTLRALPATRQVTAA